jgi:Na+-translocating ferredoxin:NAD+ oxidoreductase RnfC subunit
LDLLGRASKSGLSTYAPASGRVTDLGMVPTTSGRHCPAVELAVAQDAARVLEQPRHPPDAPTDLFGWADLCDRFGLINAAAGEPLSECFRRAAGRPVDHLIIRTVGIEPAETAPQACLLEQGTTLVEAIHKLGAALAADKTWIALTRNFRQGRRLLARTAHDCPATVVVLPERYPQANVYLLVKAVCGRVISVG